MLGVGPVFFTGYTQHLTTVIICSSTKPENCFSDITTTTTHRERERQGDRERETETERDRDRERQRQRETEND